MVVADITIAVDSCDPTKGLTPGQLISGRVICHTNQPKDFECLTLTFSGFAHVHWTETRTRYVGYGKNRRRETYTVHFTSRQNYFEYSTTLAGGGVIPAGGKSYPFKMTFPGNQRLPSSFEGSVAHVRYQLFAHLQRGFFKFDSRVTQLFAYYAPYDLNALSETRMIKEPKQIQGEKTLGCSGGSVSYEVDIPKQGFVPGEYLSFKGQFTNNSKSVVKNVVVQFHLSARYHAQGHSRHDSLVLASVKSDAVEPGKILYWDGSEDMIVPSCAPTNLGGNCGLISIQYSLEFSMVTRACSTNLSVTFPIVIGTVPIGKES